MALHERAAHGKASREQGVGKAYCLGDRTNLLSELNSREPGNIGRFWKKNNRIRRLDR
jgi:hypothetical protein